MGGADHLLFLLRAKAATAFSAF